MSTAVSLDRPILNGPYDPPGRHFVVGPNGPTGEVKEGRRPSESWIPVPVGRKGTKKAGDDAEQQGFDFDVNGERRETNSLINDIRARVELWRARGYRGVTPVTRKLLQHWADPTREDRMLFCQREAAETAIFLAEVAGRHGEPDFRTRVDPENRRHNDGLPRVGLKMATGSGKTVVMAMLIAWQVANKAYSPRDARFTSRFLVVAPGITNRDRLRVLLPADDENYDDLRGHIQALGIREDAPDGAPRRVGISIGPQYGTMAPRFVKDAAREASKARDLDLLCILGFAFEPQVLDNDDDYAATDEGFDVAAERALGRIPVLMVRMNADLLMGEELKKTGGRQPVHGVRRARHRRARRGRRGQGRAARHRRLRPHHRPGPQRRHRPGGAVDDRHRLRQRQLLRAPLLLHRRPGPWLERGLVEGLDAWRRTE